MDGHLQARHPDWFPDGTTEGERALLSVHSWVLRHEGLIILIDTGAGNDKARPQQQVLDHLSNSFLERLEAAGVVPDMVNYVLHAHVHSDHVGWNTIYTQEQWRPTFPNAVHICSRLEWEYGAALADGDERGISLARAKAGFGEPVRIPVSGTFNDSMRPLQSSAQTRLIAVDGQEVLPGLRFLPTPGHSIDHAAIELRSAGERAIFGGDVLHHPVELYDTDLVSAFCEFPEPACRSRMQLLEMTASSNALYLSAHFPLTSAVWVTKRGDGYQWEFAQ